MSDEAYPQQTPLSAMNDYLSQVFVISQLINKLAGPTIVQVVACSNDGEVAAPGTVNVQPLVNQMTGNQQPQPHGVVYNLPFLRQQSGGNATIMDPSVNDIGLACFSSRDISAVKAFAQANPGVLMPPQNPSSLRSWDWADGVYLLSIFGGVPTQYTQYLPNGGGINVVSPTQITLQAPNVSIIASDQITATTPIAAFSDDVSVANDMSVEGTTSGSGAAVITGDLTVTGTTTGTGDGVFGGVSVMNHLQSGVQSGSENSGPPVPT